MDWSQLITLESALVLALGAGLGFAVSRWKWRQDQARLHRREQEVLDQARREADTLTREARLTANEEAVKLREQTEESFSQRRRELTEQEQRLAQRESLIASQLEGLAQQEKRLRDEGDTLSRQMAQVAAQNDMAQQLLKRRQSELERIARITEEEARTQLLREAEQHSLRDAQDISRHILDEAKKTAEEQARRIISLTIQRYAASHTFESTTATLALQGDDIKGRIIGREGRNIRAFEAATGVTVLIDDTPNAVVLSAFDPVRREIAREAMQRLIIDGRIHPTRIEEVVAHARTEMDENIAKAGEEAVYKLGIPPLHPEINKILGSLRFRQSFSQNLLDHSIEVAHLTGIMAAELGEDVAAAKRAGLLHDIGKALSQEMEGSHAIVGGEFIRRHGESEAIINGVASHHDEVPHTNLLGILVSAADAISASRPGARSESMTTYIKRLEHLERIGVSFDGVEKCYAIQAGRELRVVVHPDEINDEQAAHLARNIAKKIEEGLQYPGQIRVTVVRETRCVEFAK